MDISFKTEQGRFNYRVCAVILRDGHILAMHDERSPYYYLPGGRVRLHEDAETAMLRELEEELGIHAKILRPLWLNQGFFVEDVNQERFHELCLYFLVDIAQTGLMQSDKTFTRREASHTFIFEWLDFNRLQNEYFYPVFLKKDIFRLPEHLTLLAEYE